jgi:fatty acid desaturase
MTERVPQLQSAEQDAKLERAKRRVRAIKGFYIHFLVFVVVMLILVAINIAVGPPWWVLVVLLGWGIAVLAHALAVFGQTSKRIAEWEQRKIRQIMEEA